MAWSALETRWRSLVGGHALTQPCPPFEAVTPTEAWVYAAISDPLPSVGVSHAVKVRLKAAEADIGLCLVSPTGNPLLSFEARIAPGDGVVETAFRLEPGYGPACLLVRKLSDDDSIGKVTILDVAMAAAADVDQAALLGPSNDVPPMPDTDPRNVARPGEPMWPVSLGNSCEAKVQIARTLHFRRKPNSSQAAFRLAIRLPGSAKTFGWDLFDWQGTPFNAVCAYLREDFTGLFERGDLQPSATGVMHRRLGAEHLHDFEHFKAKGEKAYTEAIVDQGYDAARVHFDEMAAAFREHLLAPGPFLYVHVCEDIPSEFSVRRLINLLAARSPDHRFHLLIVGFEDQDSDLSALADQVTKAYRPPPPPGAGAIPGATEWEGDYAAWDKALAPFDLLMPTEGAAAAQPETAAPAPQTAPELQPASEPQPTPKRGLLARLFAR